MATQTDPYYWSRDLSSIVLNIINNEYKDNTGDIVLVNKHNFGYDSLFCEWAYVIDLDNNEFEVYKGFNDKPLQGGDRFYSDSNWKIGMDGNTCKSISDYYGVRLVKAYDLNNLPTEDEFLNDFIEDEDE